MTGMTDEVEEGLEVWTQETSRHNKNNKFPYISHPLIIIIITIIIEYLKDLIFCLKI